MELTRITKDNLEHFRIYLPPGHITPEQEAVGLVSDDGYACAAALISGEDTQAAIDWLYVDKEYRRIGAGTAFLEQMEELLKGEADSFCVSYPSDIEGMDEFFAVNGYLITDGDPIYSISLAELKDSHEARTLKKMAEKEDVRTLDSLNQEEREALFDFLEGEYGPEAELLRADFKLSLVTLDPKHRVNSCLLIENIGDDKTLFVTLLASKGGPKATAVIGKALTVIGDNKDFDDYMLQFVSVNENIDRLAESLGANLKDTEVDHLRFAIKSLE